MNRRFAQRPDYVLTRRAMLRGLGVSTALPWLESFRVWGDEAVGHTVSSQPLVRFACLFAGNGFHSKEWWARGAGREMQLGKVLQPLEPHKQKMLFVRGLYNEEALKGNIHSSCPSENASGPDFSGVSFRDGSRSFGAAEQDFC
jgi:hypothetical protein